MDIRSLVARRGWPYVAQIGARAGTNIAYLRQLACAHRRPSGDLALRLVEESGGELDLYSLLSKQPKSNGTASGTASERATLVTG